MNFICNFEWNKYYNPGSSTTSRRTSDSLSYSYYSGSVSGHYYNDQINFMIRNNFYFTFGVVTKFNLDRSGFDGILGFGRKYLSNYLFAIDVKFGSNGQLFTMLIDTGSEIA